MVTYIIYTLAFIVIGAAIGYVAKDYMPSGSEVSRGANYAAAVAGALAGGFFWVLLRRFTWGGFGGGIGYGIPPESASYAHHAGDTTQPGYWVGLVFAIVGALLLLALHRLFFTEENA
ncbi:MAG TPA: hypothetical protein VFA21_06495 [Pyrinomonadaceae bacterium]|jgi:uncharacterized membrane protein YeaQ/YmgE (transglycosylase-associated protein family)|nr:hypothetical protein [Pyrinomonadaceae bacterium]